MATIKIRKNDLFHAGLVSISEELYVLITNEVKRILGDKISKINKRFFSLIISEFCNTNHHDRIFEPKSLRFSLLVFDIYWKEKDVAMAKVFLSLPVLATIKDQNGIWKMVKSRSGLPGIVEDGELWLDIELKGDNCPIEKNIEGGKKVFIVHPKEPLQQADVAA